MRKATIGVFLLALGCSAQPATEPAGASAETSGAEGPAAGTRVGEGPAGDAPRDAPQGIDAALDAALAGGHRSQDNRARDAFRHPKETLRFMGLRPDMTVIELSPGGGWYTEILAPVLCAGGGQLMATIPSTTGPAAKYAKPFLDRIARDPEVFDCVTPVTVEPPEAVSFGAPGSADMVLTFRSTHGWINRGQVEAIYKQAFEVLKPGGVFGVVQHRAAEGSDPKVSAKSGYVPEAHVIALAEQAGFELSERSELNQNPKDTRQHPEGVWTLPPTLRLGDKPEYRAIGESDRMTLRFVKPATTGPRDGPRPAPTQP